MRRTLTLVSCWTMIGLHAQQIVPGFVGGHHQAGNTINTTVNFPTDLSNVSQILMHVSLDCPAGGCDPWDRFAVLNVEVNNQDIEIGRYVTPYGNDWCDWTIDVTDYRDYLTGTQTLISHIETWQNGWLVNTEFEFISGTPTYEYIAVQNLWMDHQFTYGDTIFYSIDLPEQQVTIPANAEQVVFRMINTGHGQGNTENAAEFSQKTHEIVVNGSTFATQYLWKDDCDQNPCSPQGGTWQFNRAGWCPGQDVVPSDYDITSVVLPGSTASLDYVLEPFFNLCSPWNPSCQDGVTCPDCNYNSSTHTTPVYKITGQLIVKSSTPIAISVEENARPIAADLFPNPTTGQLNIQLDRPINTQVSIIDVSGKTVMEFTLSERHHQVDVSGLVRGAYEVRMTNDKYTFSETLLINHH